MNPCLVKCAEGETLSVVEKRATGISGTINSESGTVAGVLSASRESEHHRWSLHIAALTRFSFAAGLPHGDFSMTGHNTLGSCKARSFGRHINGGHGSARLAGRRKAGHHRQGGS
jgi:hypothetical protein